MSKSFKVRSSTEQKLFADKYTSLANNKSKETISELSSQEIEQKIHFSKSSFFLLILRILIIILFIIIWILELMCHDLLEIIEDNKIQITSIKVNPNPSVSTIISFITLYLLASKEVSMLLISIIYIFIHPFIGLKLALVNSLVNYFMLLLQLFYQRHRPFWNNEHYAKNIIACPSGYALPSNNYLITCFFYLYSLIILVRLNQKNDQNKTDDDSINKTKVILNLSWKNIVLIVYVIMLLLGCFILLANQINYLYQLLFTLVISLIIICVLLDLDTVIHNYLLKSLKNIYKVRKYKVKFFFFTSLLIVGLIVIFQYIPEDTSLNKVEDNIRNSITYASSRCSFVNIQQLGAKETFLLFSEALGIMGSFWGVSFTIEKRIDIWEQSDMSCKIKATGGIVILNLGYYLISLYEIKAFELDFIMLCVKYFFYYYLLMGIIPLIANTKCEEIIDKFKFDFEDDDRLEKIKKINKQPNVIVSKTRTTKLKKQRSAIFGKTIFSHKYSGKNLIENIKESSGALFNPIDTEDLKVQLIDNNNNTINNNTEESIKSPVGSPGEQDYFNNSQNDSD